MMTRYEVLMLTIPGITEDESKGIEQNITKLIKDVKGEMISFERWGKYRLAYQVKKNDYGIYFLSRFEIKKNPTLFKELQSLFTLKYNEVVMRNVIVKIDTKQGLEYKRPSSVEDMPARDVDSFLRDNKMDDLISSDRSDRKDRYSDRREGGYSDRRESFSDRRESSAAKTPSFEPLDAASKPVEKTEEVKVAPVVEAAKAEDK